jgi:hypothetical protein
MLWPPSAPVAGADVLRQLAAHVRTRAALMMLILVVLCLDVYHFRHRLE